MFHKKEIIFISMLGRWFSQFIPCVTEGKQYEDEEWPFFFSGKMYFGFLGEVEDDIPLEAAVESKKVQESFMIVKNSFLQA